MADPTVLNRKKFDAAGQDYLAWVAAAMQLQINTAPDGRMELTPINLVGEAGSSDSPILLDSMDDRSKLWDLQRGFRGGAIEAQPEGDPSQIAGIAGIVLRPYHVRRGRALLAGCTLEPRPFLRISTTGKTASEVVHHWFDCDGSAVAVESLPRLPFDRLIATEPRLRKNDRRTMKAWIDAATSGFDPLQRIGVTVVWCRWVSGKVRIQFDSGHNDSIAFEGWAMEWADGLIDSPKYRCAAAGLESYNIVCLEDGTVTVLEAVGQCELTGKETLRSALEVCAVSGRTVLSERLTTCPITGMRFLADPAEVCSWCRRAVAPPAMEEGRCEQCRNLRPIANDDPVVVALQHKFPEFRGVRSWRGWIAREQALLVGSRWLTEVLVLLQTDDTQVQRTASRRRLSTTWQFEG